MLKGMAKYIVFFATLLLLLFAVSAQAASTTGTVIVITPKSDGENAVKGEPYEISWQSSGFGSDAIATIQLRDFKNTERAVWTITASTPNTGLYRWNVRAAIPDGKYYIWVNIRSGSDARGNRVIGSDFSDFAVNVMSKPSVDLKINGRDGPIINVNSGDIFTIGWTSKNVVNCTGTTELYNNDQLFDVDSDTIKLSGRDAGNVPAGATKAIITIVCNAADGNSVKDGIQLNIKNRCSNGILDKGEQCDGSNLGKNTCKSIGYADGKLGCNIDCTFDVGNCLKYKCGNNVCEKGEDPNNCPEDCPPTQDVLFSGASWICQDGYNETRFNEQCQLSTYWRDLAEKSCSDRCNKETGKCGVNYYAIGAACEKEQCTDSDGGKNYYVKGVIGTGDLDKDLCYVRNKYNIFEDMVSECDSAQDCGLMETYCREDGEKTNRNIYCPFGCKNGACINANSQDIKGKCVDSDNGNIHIKGKVTYRAENNQLISEIDDCCDHCNTANAKTGKYVVEYSCNPSGEISHEFTECPNGCKDGACVTNKIITKDDVIDYIAKDGVNTKITKEDAIGYVKNKCLS